VVSYSTSPPADVVYASDGRTAPASVNLMLPGGSSARSSLSACSQGAKQPDLARQFVDFMLDITFQEDIPLQMFVYPANSNAALPELFTDYAQTPDAPVTLEPAAIEANREAWIEGWAGVMR
jgi:thiamine transport system substrate-binding protein